MNVLRNQCSISQAWDPRRDSPEPAMVEFDAIWDTGATGSVITQSVVDACGLVATGMTRVIHVDGAANSETYLANIILPNKVVFTSQRVTKGKLPGGIDILIGMDIINQGDFSVTNFDGLTNFSFRVPSSEHIDFVQERQRPRLQHGGRPNPKRPNLTSAGRKKGKGKKKRKR